MESKIKKYKSELITYSILGLALVLFVLASIFVYYKVDKDLGGNLFSEIVGIAITVIVIERVLALKSWFKWKKIEGKVMELFEKEIHNFFIDITNILHMNQVVSTSDDSMESFNKALEASLAKQIDELANLDKLTIDESHGGRLAKGDYGRIFNRRYEILNNFQIKYQEYLKPDLLIAIIEIQEQLKSIDLNITLHSKGKSWLSNPQFFEVMSDRFLRIIRAIKVIKDHGYLKMI